MKTNARMLLLLAMLSLPMFAWSQSSIDNDNDGYDELVDCDDNNNLINPGASEVCNGIDDNCNGLTDDGGVLQTYYADADGDGFGDPAVFVEACVSPSGYVSNNTDCNDSLGTVNPSGTEVCNTIDDNCNGLVDDGISISVDPVSGPGDQCVPMTYGFSTWSVPAVAGATSYTWTFPSNMQVLQGQGTNTFVGFWTTTAVHAGVIGDVCVTVSNGCASATSCKKVNIQIYAPGRPGSIFGPGKICPGQTVNYFVNPVPKTTSYVWTFPTGMTIVSGLGTNSVNVLVDNTYTGGSISIVGVNGCGASAIRTKITSRNTPTTPGVITGISSGLCGASNISYTTIGSTTASSYAWTLPGGATISGGAGTNSISADFTAAVAGGNITVASVNGCGTSAARILKVALTPAIPASVSGPLVNCPSSTQTYTVNPVYGATGYTWTKPQTATIMDGQGTGSLLLKWGPTELTGMAIKVKADNACGSSSLRTSSGYSTSFAVCPPRLANAEKNGISVFPNPASGTAFVNIESVGEAKVNMQLFDVTGRQVLNQFFELSNGVNTLPLNIEGIASGLYKLSVMTGTNVTTISLHVD